MRNSSPAVPIAVEFYIGDGDTEDPPTDKKKKKNHRTLRWKKRKRKEQVMQLEQEKQ